MLEHKEDGRPAGVDVMIACHQYGRFLRECVTSVLAQGIQDLRVLVIDNASTDNSLEMAQQLAAEDRRVEVVARRRNLGPHASFNEGIDWATSKYFLVLCADDLLTPGCLERAISVMERHPNLAFAYGRAIWRLPEVPMCDLDSKAAEWRVVGGADLIERFCRTAYNHVTGPVVVRTVMQKLAGYYRPELPHTQDFEMWMRLARLAPAAETKAAQGVLQIHEPNRSAVVRHRHSAQLPHQRDPLLWHWQDEAAFESFFAHEGRFLRDASRMHQLARRSLAERAYWAAIVRLCRGHTTTSGDLWRFAIKRRPSVAFLPPVSYLLRRHDAGRRISAAASEMRYGRGLPLRRPEGAGYA